MPSSSGIPVLGNLASAHVGQLYRNQRDLIETLVPYFVAGLAQNERCIWVTSHTLCAADARAALTKAVPELPSLERERQIEIIDHASWYQRSGAVRADEVIRGWLDAEEEALASGYRALRVSGNMCWLNSDQWRTFADYEARVHMAFQERQIVALCSYPLDGCDSHQIVDVLRNHSISLVRAGDGWSAVHGATAALALLEQERPRTEGALVGREQLVRLDRVVTVLGDVTTRAELATAVTDVVMPALEVDGLAIIEHGVDRERPTVVGHGAGVEVLQQIANVTGDRTVWSSDGGGLASPGAPPSAFAAIPLYAQGHMLGTCILGVAESRTFSPWYRAFVHDVARQLARAFDRSATYERLEHERERAELASRAKDEFLAMLGHELRNPLSPILTATQLMRLRAGDVHDRERTVIERQVKHMIRLVDDLLDVSRITRGKVELRRRPVELADVIAQAAELSSPALEERAHRLTLDTPGAGVVVHADAARLAQVISNLLTNAAKYTPHGGDIRLLVEVAPRSVSITVRDNGIGIDPKLLPHIFDLFVQGRQGIDRASGGLGLGLAIAKSLLVMHGGTIRARSEGDGKGSEFTIELPRYANTRPSRPHTSGSFPILPVRSRRVLVVDDNEDAAFLFSEALKRLGHKVEVAYDGPSALACAREWQPEVAFLDIGLPVMDGYELGRRLRELGGKPPRLVAVTGYGHTSDRERSREAGFDLHLVKPIELATVQEALAKLG